MLAKAVLSLLWFPASLALLYVNVSLLQPQKPSQYAYLKEDIISPLADSVAYHVAPSENTSMILGTKITAADARGKLLYDFLFKHDSPLAPFSDLIVDEADKNGIDFRLVVAIAMCESNLGKRIPSKNSHNAWGIAVYTGEQYGKNFSSWPHAIAWVSTYIKERYINRGFTTLKQIGAVYAPPSVATGHSWSRCVEAFQESIF